MVLNLSLYSFLFLLGMAALVGWLAQRVVGVRGGLAAAIGLGFVGGLAGVVLRDLTHSPELFVVTYAGTRFPFVWALAGAVLLLAIVRGLQKGRR